MTVFKNVQFSKDVTFVANAYVQGPDVVVQDGLSLEIEAAHLTLFPALIDPHVHFRVPGQEYKEDWRTGARAALRGGYTTVFDMPNNKPACITRERLHEKKSLIDTQLKEAGLPLHYELFLGADKSHFDEIPRVRDEIIGLKVFMGSSTGDLLMDDDSSLHAAFAIAAHCDLMLGIHAEDECLIQERQKLFAKNSTHAAHSVIRSPEVAAKAIEKVIALVRLYGTRVYILHVSSIPELELIRAAKKEGLPVYAETSPHHLFLNTDAYAHLHGRAQMNPPLREAMHQEALFAAIADGVIDTIGTDHAPHTLCEKDKPYGESPSGVPGIETNLPLLLNSYHQGRLTLQTIARLTSVRIKEIFHYKGFDDLILIDLNKQKKVIERELKTKCGWSPFAGYDLKGWPVYSILNNAVINLEDL